MRDRWLAAAAGAGLMCVGASGWAEDAAKWGAHVDFEGKAGTDRHLGEADLFLPVAQNGTSLLFADIRTRMDDESSREGNFGLGIRHMLESGWNLGGYGFFDRRRTEYHHHFNQVTVGAEALSLDWDLRANGYLPVGRTTHQEDSLNSAEMTSSGVIFRGGEERSLGGFDAEIGWRLPVFAGDAGQQVRVYAGGYRFADEGVPMVAGPRGRAEVVFDEVPGLWDGSRLALGAELQHDDPRGTQGFLSARLRIPLQAEAPARLTPMERRMTDPIVRDIDVVAQAGAYGASETATAANGGTLMVVSSATTTGANLQTALNNAGTNSTVLLSGTFDTGNDTTLTLKTGQTVMGTGSLTVRSASGRTATLTRSTGATITSTNATVLSNLAAIEMAANSTLSGMTLTPTTNANNSGIYAVRVNGVSGATIVNNTITATSPNASAMAVRIEGAGATNVTVSGNAISVSNSNGGTAIGLYTSGTSVTLTNNTFANTNGGATRYDVYKNGTAITATGNTYSGIGCSNNGAGMTCP